MNQPTVRLTYRLLSYLISGLIAAQPLLPAVAATLTPTGNTAMEKAANGVPIINIATPNKAGISHNQFTDYNVGKEGLILNNAADKLTQTQLGGLINGNANLKAAKEAKGIINEVIGGSRSQLQGYTEVAGKAANVMVANPFGITCNGCGFINTPQATLTTGKPVFDASGNLQALDVKKGSIIIEGQGLDASSGDALSIISRATEVNAAIHAKDLKVIAGANRVGNDGSVQAQQGEGAAPTVAVDTGALGGMYANRIHLVSSEKGVGVNLGDLNARQGDITLDANGKLTVHNSLASGALSVKGEELALTGDHKASGNLSITSQGDIALSNGSLTSDGDVVLNSGGTISHANEKLTAGKDVTLRAKNISQDSASQINAARDIATQAADTLRNKGQMTAGQNLTASATALTQEGKLLAKGRAGLSASTLTNSGSVQGDSLSVSSSTLSNMGSLLSGGDLTVNAKDFIQSGSSGAKGNADITATGTLSNTGSLISDGAFTLNAQDVTQQGVLSGGEGLMVNAQFLASGKKSVTHSNAAITLNVTTAMLEGETSAGGDLQLQSDTFTTTANAQLQSGNNLSLSARDVTLAGTQAAQKNMSVNALEKLTHSGKSSAASLDLSALELTNSGVLTASALVTQSQTLTNRGLMQGDKTLLIDTQQLDNQQNGTLYSAANLTLVIPDISNRGLITSDRDLTLRSGSLSNPGRVIGSTLNVNVTSLNGEGLLQGAEALSLAGDSLSQGSNGRWLTAGSLSLSGKTLNTAGTTQGQDLTIQMDSWMNSGSVLATGNLNATLDDSLLNTGDLMSQGRFGLNAPVLTNHGSILSAGDMSLAGIDFTSDGILQSDTISLRHNSIDNKGTVTGLNGLSLNSTGTLNNSGDLMSQKSLALSVGDVTNSGRLQGQNITLDGSSLANSGAIQSALDLALTLSGDVITATSSKITAQGDARLSGNALNNRGLISAKTLEVKGYSLSNDGEISGVNGLNVTLNDNLQQQGKMLTGGQLNVNAKEVSNSGQFQGAETQISGNSLINSGSMQGDNGLTLTLLNTLTNQTSGVLLSQNTLNLTAPELTNNGTIQGNGRTTLSALKQARNDGKMLSSSDLIFASADYNGSGWLQATNLILNVAKLVSNGTVIAADQATLIGNNLTNGGTFQAAQLNVNTQTVTNSGTMVGNQGLTLKGNRLDNAGGKVFSGGDMLAEIASLSGAGQLVALGNLTLKLSDNVAAQGIIAANKQLAISSQGDITNGATLQGNGITLTAAGRLSNNGQLIAGNGITALGGSQIAMNAGGSLQAGGDVNLTSQSNISLDGFTGTSGCLLLNAVGSIVNTALLYAGKNLSLFADGIQNLRGDMLAGNNLVIQRDAYGAASTNVVNSSGNIETTFGDITIKTGTLLNERTGLTSTAQTTNLITTYPWLGQGTANIPISILGADTLVQHKTSSYSYVGSCGGAYCFAYEDTRYYYAPAAGYGTRKFALNQTENRVSAQGGSALIASGRDMTIVTEQLNNQASSILANRNLALTGETLTNQSYQSGTFTEYAVYAYERVVFGGGGLIPGYSPTHRNTTYESTVPYVLKGSTTESVDGETFRAVIQAGGDATASFTHLIGNENITARGDRVSNTISAPDLNRLSQQSVGAPEQAQLLTDIATVSIDSPEWYDQISDVLRNMSGEKALDTVDTSAWPLPTGKDGYFVTSNEPDSPYVITVNPKLDGLGQIDPALFGDLWHLLGMNPGSAPQETRGQYTNASQFLGSSYMLGRLNLYPDNDYRFLGDAAFDTRYVSNYVLNQTGNRYINGLGSDLDQMRYLMDSAAEAQTLLGLTFGIALTAEQIAALDHSILWWESATLNGQTVMVPKVYLSPKDVTVQSGSVISGNNVQLAGGNIDNSGSSLIAHNDLSVDNSNSISNLYGGLLSAGNGLKLSALADINNIGSVISGKTVQLESGAGNINNITQTEQWNLGDNGRNGSLNISGTRVGQNATISATGDVSMVAAGNIDITGARVDAGHELMIEAGNNINITANQVNGSSRRSDFWWQADTSVAYGTNQASSVTAGGNMVLHAGNDLDITASHLDAGQSAHVSAGNDINLNARKTYNNRRAGSSENHSSSADRSTVSAGDNVTLVAGQDVTSQAAGIAAEGSVGIQTGRDVNLLAEATVNGGSTREKKKTIIDESVRQQGTEIASGGNTTIIAGRDINSQAAQVTAGGDIGVAADRDVNLTTAMESDYHYKEETKTKKGFLSKKTTHTIAEDSATREAGTLLSGENVTVRAGNNLLVEGSSVVGDDEVMLHADNNVDIVAATNTDSSWRFKETKKSGLMGTGGIGITLGSSKTTHNLREQGTTQSQSFSTIGSTGGSVDIDAGNQAHIGGADIVAGKDLALSGNSVIIEPGHDKRTRDETFEQKSSGLTLALSGSVGGAVNNVVSAVKEAKDSSDGRLAALQATKAALSGYQASQAVDLDTAKGKTDKTNNNTIGISVSLTTQHSKSKQHQESEVIAGSSLNAGNNLSVVATGKNGGINSGDILISGSQLKAGADTLLSAQHDILLHGAANTQKTTGSNSSSGGGIGASLGAGSGGYGLSVFANVNSAKGHEKGDGISWTESTVDSGGTTTLNSGRDAVLTGAQVSGDKIVSNIGRDLLLSSLRDSDNYRSTQSSIAAGGSVTVIGAGGASGYISASQDKMKSRYDSVLEQTGVYAGSGGYDITVGKHTQLDGAVIASTATADKNNLDTGTLSWAGIRNEADYKVSHAGASLGGGGSDSGKGFTGNMTGGMVSAMSGSGHAEGMTQSAISKGTITVRDAENQQQDVAGLSRDTEHANDSISPIFDKEKEQQRLQAVQLISDIGSQVSDIVRTEGQLAALKAQKDIVALESARAQLLKEHKTVTDEAVSQRVYDNAMQQYGTGSDIQRAIQGVTAGLSGLAGGNIAGALAGASAPELANFIGHGMGLGEDDVAGRVLAHAILGGVVASLQGNSATAGAVGAASGELIAGVIARQFYPDTEPSKLSEEQKQTISALTTVASGITGGLVGNSALSGAAGAQAGKNTVENNLLGGGTEDGQVKAVQEHAKNIMSCSTAPGSASCQKGLAMQDALMVALPAGLGGGLLAAATPELAAAAQAVLAGCQSAAILCLNQAGILTAEVATPGGVGAAGILTVGKNATEIAAAKAEVTAVNSAKPGWLQNVQAGNKFNAEQSKNYPYNELYVNKPNGNGYYRVDSYNPATGEIVSRKFTQFADITEATATNYIREAVNKYPSGATIAKVPSSGALAGDALRGANIIEVPPQVKPIPQSVLNAADKAGVVIRDTNGKIYQ